MVEEKDGGIRLRPIERSPLVFFGRYEGRRYWNAMKRQFKTMVDAGRAPDWLMSDVMTTDDPDEVTPFYRRLLELG